MSNWSYYKGSFALTIIGILAGLWLGFSATGTVEGALSIAFIIAILSVLEISLSFDNAVVNATVLRDMDAKWRHRFLTWGILIAVFGMRIVFPLLIVAIAAHLGPISAVSLAIGQPDEYARILTEAHTGIAAFGGTFLFMVGLKYFFDADKEVHWIGSVERLLAKFSDVEAAGIAIVLLCLYGVSTQLPSEEATTFLISGIFGLLSFIAVEGLGSLMEASQAQVGAVHRSGAAAFIYLEVLDASFSFDGVIGAFALSNNLFVIAIGLGIGAMFVRSMTIMLVDKGTLTEYRYLEHGAFWAILALALIMYAQVLTHIPEVVTGLIGATLIGLSFWSSVRHNKADAAEAAKAEATDAKITLAAE